MPLLRLVLTATLVGSAAAADPVALGFAGPADLQRLQLDGDAGLDPARSAAPGSGSLHLGPGASAVLRLRDADGSGRIAFKVYEDGAQPADPKQRGSGALWGVVQQDGCRLVAGALYAPYLSGADSYALANYVPPDSPFSFVRYLGIKRHEGWHAWTFDFDAAKGLTIACDGAAVTAKRFDWNESKQRGFTGLVFTGDGSPAKGGLWIDDIEVTLGGPMQVGPKPPPPPEPIVPATDPAPEGPVPALVAAVKDVHPRLLFGPDDVPRMKAFYGSEAGKPFRDDLLGYLQASTPDGQTRFLKDATDGQRIGYWRMPTVALHYVLTGDKTSFERTVGYMKLLLTQPEWESAPETDSGMSAGNIMIGAGLALDWLWNDLDPAFREQFRQACLHHARAMYYGGHMMKAPNKTHYWQADPANNHRWHRDAGLTTCLLAAYSGDASEAWILGKLKAELDTLAAWLPPDGTSHEGPGYLVFGLSHLVLAMQASDRCLGTAYLQQPFFRNVPGYFVHSLTPDLRGRFNFGDMFNTDVGKLDYGLCLYKCTAVHKLADEQALLDEVRAKYGGGWAWMGLVWYDPAVSGGSATKVPDAGFFDDIGVLFARDGWRDDGVGVMFKCGPLGGYTLNRFRDGNNMAYINVAHDDPDANSFIIWGAHRLLAETDRYSERKASANHNTILVNGVGQLTEGRPEGDVWSQPGGEMARQAIVTAVKIGDQVDLIEGEAGGAYIATKAGKAGPARPALERYRRALAFAKGAYVLVLDDIRAPSPVAITWLMQGPDLQAVSGRTDAWRLIAGDADCPFSVATSVPVHAAIVDSPADGKKGAGAKETSLLGFKQLRLAVDSERLCTASVYDTYHRQVAVTLDSSDPAKLVATVQGQGIDDRWEWTPAADPQTTYTLVGTRNGQPLAASGPGDRPAGSPAAPPAPKGP